MAEAERRVGCTWDHLIDLYGQDRDHWVQAFSRHHRKDLVRLLDRNSGYKPRETYADLLVETVDRNPDLTWTMLEDMFDRTEAQLRATLYFSKRGDLVKGRMR
ncbi:MAG: hypothetical protein M0R66_02120 [Candidatus Omnitrophica bacterium]|nr:hypothetical protein [Candidatus Omnitrophota bacterium]